jgi:hypothetical protein
MRDESSSTCCTRIYSEGPVGAAGNPLFWRIGHPREAIRDAVADARAVSAGDLDNGRSAVKAYADPGEANQQLVL